MLSGQKTVDVENLVGMMEVCNMLGYSSPTGNSNHINNLLVIDPTFPKPLAWLRCGRLWDARHIQTWLDNRAKAAPPLIERPPAPKAQAVVSPAPSAPKAPVAQPPSLESDKVTDANAKFEAWLGKMGL